MMGKGPTPPPRPRPARRFSALAEDLKRKDTTMTSWMPTLRTATPEEGCDLAVKLTGVAANTYGREAT